MDPTPKLRAPALLQRAANAVDRPNLVWFLATSGHVIGRGVPPRFGGRERLSAKGLEYASAPRVHRQTIRVRRNTAGDDQPAHEMQSSPERRTGDVKIVGPGLRCPCALRRASRS